jgi:hypothetical protein
MKVKDLLWNTDYTFENFKKDFRIVNEDNVLLVLRNYGFNDEADFVADTGLTSKDLIGYLADVTYCKVYTEPELEHDPLNVIIKASEQLYAMPTNIPDDMDYSAVSIIWLMGGSAGTRLFPHNLLDYMEPEGEGDTQLTWKDYALVLRHMLDDRYNFINNSYEM